MINNVIEDHNGAGQFLLDELDGNYNGTKLIANNVFYNNDGPIFKYNDDAGHARTVYYNNIFDSNEACFDANSLTLTYCDFGLHSNVFKNNTNILINAGISFDEFAAIGAGAGGSGGYGTLGGENNQLTGTVNYSNAATGDYRLKRSSSVKESGWNFDTAGFGLAPFSASYSGSLSLGTGGVGDEVTVSGRSYKKYSSSPPVWRRIP